MARSRRGGWRSTGDSADPRPAKTIRMSNDGITIALAAANSGVTCFPAKFQIARAAKGDYNQPGPGSEIGAMLGSRGRVGVLFSSSFGEFRDFVSFLDQMDSLDFSRRFVWGEKVADPRSNDFSILQKIIEDRSVFPF